MYKFNAVAEKIKTIHFVYNFLSLIDLHLFSQSSSIYSRKQFIMKI